MSRPPRFFITPDRVRGPEIIVSGEDVRHIVTVLRMKTGDELLLCDGNGTEYSAKIVEAGRSEIRTAVVSQTRREIAWPRVTLGQGLPKSDKMDWIVQKATELGVSSIVPLITERTIMKVRDEEKRITRWQKIAKEAAMQSNRADIPLIEKIQPFHEFIFSLDPGPRPLLIFPWEEGTVPIKDVLRGKSEAQKIVVLIGPEGGFSTAEAVAAQSRGFSLVSLGPNILRAETAALAALSMIVYEYR